MATVKPELIQFPCSVAKVQTLTDGGIRVTLDLSEGAIEAAAKLMVCQTAGATLQISAAVKRG